MLKNTYLSGTESQESLPLRYEVDGHRLRMASRASVAEVCVPYSFGRSMDFAGNHFFQCCSWLFAESFTEVFQSCFTGQAGEGFLHAVHEVLYCPAVAKDLFHFLQIVDLELYGIGFRSPAVTAYEQFGARLQGLAGFGDFSVDGCRRGNLQVAGMCLRRSPVCEIYLAAYQDACTGKSDVAPWRNSNGIPAHVCVVPNATSVALPVGMSVSASPNICANPSIMPP